MVTTNVCFREAALQRHRRAQCPVWAVPNDGNLATDVQCAHTCMEMLVLMKQSLDWKFLRWPAVKGIANNDFTRVVSLIPIAGYLILFNDQLMSLASFDTLAGVGEGDASPFVLESLTKLRLVFFGSLLVLCSYATYWVFHPEVLETSSNDLEFFELVRQRYSVYELAEIEDNVHSENWTKRTQAFWLVVGKPRLRKHVVSGYRPDVRSVMFRDHGPYIGFLAREYWIGMMHTHRLARVLSLLFGIVGYLLLALPTLDVAQAVLRQMLFG